MSLEAPFHEGEENSMLDVLPDDEVAVSDGVFDKESLQTEVCRTLALLPERERTILSMFYGIGQSEKTLEEIGARLNLSRERVRQIKEKTLKKLRLSEHNKLLKPFWGT